MSDANPYRAPAASVGKLPDVQAKPEGVFWALALLWIAWAAGFAKGAFTIANLDAKATTGPLWIGMFFVATISAVWYVILGRRKNWARLVFIVLAAIGSPFALYQAYVVFPIAPMAALFDLVLASAHWVAACLLATHTSKEWFKPNEAEVASKDVAP